MRRLVIAGREDPLSRPALGVGVERDVGNHRRAVRPGAQGLDAALSARLRSVCDAGVEYLSREGSWLSPELRRSFITDLSRSLQLLQAAAFDEHDRRLSSDIVSRFHTALEAELLEMRAQLQREHRRAVVAAAAAAQRERAEALSRQREEAAARLREERLRVEQEAATVLQRAAAALDKELTRGEAFVARTDEARRLLEPLASPLGRRASRIFGGMQRI